MSPYITIDKGNKSNTLASDVNLKEEIKMSLINMAMNIGHFNIKISINKDEEKKKEMMRKKIEHEQRINEALEQRNNLMIKYGVYETFR